MGNSRRQQWQAKPRPGRGEGLPGIWTGYGKLLKLFRERAGLTQQQLAEAVGYSCEQVASIEQGRRPAKVAFTEAAEGGLGAGGALRVLQEDVDMARLPAFFQNFAAIEPDAVSFYWYGNHVVPGLLQTEDYARGLLNAHCPPLGEDTIDQRLTARLERQVLLTRAPAVECSFVIGESALRCPVGGGTTLRAQLHQLLKHAELRNVEIQVVPTSHGSHAGLHGPMGLLETAKHQHVAYFESHGESVVITDRDKASAFGLRYGKLRSQALGEGESARLIERIAGEL